VSISTAFSAAFDAARLANRLQETIGSTKFKLWFQTARYHMSGSELHVSVHSPFVADWIEHHFHDQLLQVVEAELGEGTAVKVGVTAKAESTAAPAAAPASRKPAAQPVAQPVAASVMAAGPVSTVNAAPNSRLIATTITQPFNRPAAATAAPAATAAVNAVASHVNSPAAFAAAHASTRSESMRHDLTDFIVGPCNELAFTAASRLVDGVDAAFSMLFIHGGCGLGKTHLLQGMCRRFAALHPDKQVLYTTAEQFTNDYILAVRSNKVAEFRRKLRHVQLLAVDDVHFMASKSATQTEFLHTFDAMDLAGARLVLASDAHPKAIKQFSDALVSRFMSGMVVQVTAPDAETRGRIIRSMAQRRNMKLVDGVVQMLASQSTTSVRELEGTLTKLSALASLTREPAEQDKPIGHALVHRLAGYTSSGTSGGGRPIRLEQIMDTVCHHLRVEKQVVLGPSRHRMVVLARSVIIFLARQLTTMSYPELARALHKPNHSTIVTAAQRIEEQVKDRQPIPLVESLHVATVDQLVEQLRRRVVESSASAA
jgi:chromosomal replication initiator protein